MRRRRVVFSVVWIETRCEFVQNVNIPAVLLWRATLTAIVSSPAHSCVVLCLDPAAVIVSAGDTLETPSRWTCLSVLVPAPAAYNVSSFRDSARMTTARGDRTVNTSWWRCLPVKVLAPTIDYTSDVDSACVVPTRAN